MGLQDYTSKPNTPQAYIDFERQGYNVSQINGQYFVQIDGKSEVINPWDTVWTVSHRHFITEEKENNQAKQKEELNSLLDKFHTYCEQFQEALDNMKQASHTYVSYLWNNHATFLSDLKGTSAYEEGKLLRDEKYQTSADETKALSLVLRTNNEVQSKCSHMMYSV